MESYKQEKIIIIMYEYLNDKREFYPISNVPLDKAKFFYKDDDGLFKLMAVSDYTVKTELNENRLYIVNAAIKDNSEKFQIGYEINFKAAEYESPLPVLSVLTKMYNQLIEDTRILHSYIRKQCFVADGKEQALVLPALPEYTVWCMGENGKMFALPVSELYERFGNLIKAMKKVLDEYIEQKKEEIRGPAGAIDDVTASVNSNAGTPKVTVSLAGTPERRKIDLKFENLKGDKPIKGTDYYTQQEKEQFTTEMVGIVKTEGNKVVEQVKSIVAGNPATTNALTLSGKTRVEFEQDVNNLRDFLINKCFEETDENIIKNASFIDGKEIAWNTGEVTDNPNMIATVEYSPISKGMSNKFHLVDSQNNKIKFSKALIYNNENTQVTGFFNNTEFSIPFSSNKIATKVRLNVLKSELKAQDNYLALITDEEYQRRIVEKTLKKETAIVPPLSLERIYQILSLDNFKFSLLQKTSYNLYDKSKAIYDSVLDAKGYIIKSEGTGGETIIVDCMEIKPNTEYSFTYNTWLIQHAYWIDAYGKPIKKVDISTTKSRDVSPDNAYGVRCSTPGMTKEKYKNSKIMINEGNTLLPYREYEGKLQVRGSLLPSRNWSDYHYYAIGDSRTYGDGVTSRDKAYPKVIEKNTGIITVNGGVSGSTFCKRSTVSTKTMFEQALEVPANTDIVTIFGGTNDRIVGVTAPAFNPTNERGTSDYFVDDSIRYDVTTFRGAVRQTIKNIKTRCPKAIIIMIVEDSQLSPDKDHTGTPYQYGSTSGMSLSYDGGPSVKDMIIEIAREYRLPILNLSECAMTGKGADKYLNKEYQPFTDNLHESDFGNEMMARAIAGEMAKYLW